MYEPCQPCNAPNTGLEYVGGRNGEFAMEPQMKYVGHGGDYSVPRTRNMTCCFITLPLALLALLGLLAWLCWPTDECRVGLQNWQIGWDQQKQTRCCARGFPSCAPEPGAYQNKLFGGHPPSGPMAMAQGPEPPMAMAQGPVDPYNCALGDLNWQAGWALEKKQWCCTNHGKGCGHDEEATASMYDCNAGTENWVKGWSQNKKDWCCQHGYKGCNDDSATVAGAGYGAGSHGGATPFGAPVATAPQGFVPYAAR